MTLRFGIIENTGGLGVNLHAFEDHAEVRIDAFDFDRRNPSDLRGIFPRLRVTGMLELASHIHVQLGFDDPFNESLRTLFLGGVLRFTDDDLKAMLTIAPRP
jgi:phospholipid/cholesterol/gamma-HCH transport system substrate-binding protein